jgi:membrane fusion protein, adhesin transport system
MHTLPSTKLFAGASYNEQAFPALRLTRSSILVKRIAKAILVLLGVAANALVFLPWQQTVAGRGMVVTVDPRQRPQPIDAPISGRIVNWHTDIVEGHQVTEGEVLVEIQVIDPEIRKQLQQQVEATERKLAADRLIVKAYEERLAAYKLVRATVIQAGEANIKQAREKVQAEQQGLIASKAKAFQLEENRVRAKKLYDKKVASELETELADAAAAEARTKVEQAETYIRAAEEEVKAKIAELDYKTRAAEADINSATAVYTKAIGDVAATEKDVADLKSKQALQVQKVTAPLDGVVLKLYVFQAGQVVSAGQPLLEIVPSTIDRAVAIKVDGNDAPLVSTKQADGRPRKVRLQFEGWPAVQFSGWPSVARGTFGGEVFVVDSTDDGTGKFRVLIKPDPDDQPWPSPDILRQGVRANGWVLLDTVPLGQEVWRQFNGFPPVVNTGEDKAKEEKLLRSKK